MAIKLNQLPIVAVWYKPEEAIRRVLDGKAFLGTETILGIYSFTIAILFIRAGGSGILDLGIRHPLVNILSNILAALLITHIEIYAVTAIIKWGGRLIGGVGTWDEVKTVLAWNKLTYVTLYILLVVLDLLFSDWRVRLVLHPPDVDWLGVMLVLAFASIMIWRFVIYWRMISEVHQLKVWQAPFLAFSPIMLLGIFIGTLIIIVQ